MEDIKITNFLDLHKKYNLKMPNMPFTPIWHYTSTDGLLGIIRNNPSEHQKMHFWFTRSDCLNDTSEGKHVLDLFKQVCSDLLNDNKIDRPFYNSIVKYDIPPHEFIGYPTPPKEDGVKGSVLDCVPCHAFICSFSLAEDSLDMWRYYSKENGGYALKLYPFLFDKLKKYEYSDYDENAMFIAMKSFKVIYDRQEKEEILSQIILDTFLAYKNSKESASAIKKMTKQFLQYALKKFEFQFKHECYATEREYRFIIYRPIEKPEKLKNELPDIQYRKQNGMIIPYLDIVVENGILSGVRISPFINSATAKDTTTEYLHQCGFRCDADLSELPVRK